ncbi:MobF family relaxase [Azospirillum sp. BE72]|uniref:MobF family relaxase n=1 Tax=Azospirillum sp. BE72 TaxID=2817776 RepID=UPI00285F0847|nr:MobF family relaxase [Azospirillum sp. BE72]MDR6772684.1 conjugative relaxase-like TrwC/TraI family protein [Azospirillum sp. BE72]
MLSIRKSISPAYYLEELGWSFNPATGYYTRAGVGGPEPDGVWYNPSGQFGVPDGAIINPRLFAQLHAGFDGDGRPLVRNAGAAGRKEGERQDAKRVPGLDLTFSAPKSVSLLWALCPETVRQEIESAHRHAVRTALHHLELHLAWVRVGKDGEHRIPGRIIAACWQHGASRPTTELDDDGHEVSLPGDMQLHTHGFILNLLLCRDGKIRALDAAPLYANKLALGAIYRAALADVLRTRLGVGIHIIDDTFEVDGVPFALIDEFSKRSRAAQRELAAQGRATATAREKEVAVLSTRCGKDYSETAEARHRRWRSEATAAGFPPDALNAVFATGSELTDQSALDELEDLADRVTESSSVVTEARIWQRVAVAMQGIGDYDAIATEVERQLRRNFLCIGEDGRGQPLYTTPAMIDVEQAVEDGAKQLAGSARHRLDQHLVDAVLTTQAHRLSDEQRAAVVLATTGPDLAVIEGGAGTGKSHALTIVARLYQQAGRRVVGAAAAWRVARQLGEDCGIDSRATMKWVTDLRLGRDRWDRNTVLILDEAGMTDARELRTILDAAIKAEAKVILTGDRRQLTPVGPGPALELAVGAVGRSIRLRQARRQIDPRDRDIATLAGDGDAAKALAALDKAGRLRLVEGWQATLDSTVADWAAFSATHPDRNTLILAQTNAEVRHINAQVRAVLKERGLVARQPEVLIRAGAASGTAHDLALALGDTVRFYRRDETLDVINGTMGTVVSIAATGDGHADVEVAIDDRRVRFSTRQLYDSDVGHILLGHSYASTVHGAQGLTVDDVWAAMAHGTRTGTSNSTYVMLSRNRHHVRLVVNRTAIEDDIRDRSGERRRPGREAIMERMAADLARPAIQHSALNILRRLADPTAEAASSTDNLLRAAAGLRTALRTLRDRAVAGARQARNAARAAVWLERFRTSPGIATRQEDPPGPEPDLLDHLRQAIERRLGASGPSRPRVITGARLSAPIPHRLLDIAADGWRIRLRDTGGQIRVSAAQYSTPSSAPTDLLDEVYRAIGSETRRRGWTDRNIQADGALAERLREGFAPIITPPAPSLPAKPKRRTGHTVAPIMPPDLTGPFVSRKKPPRRRGGRDEQ